MNETEAHCVPSVTKEPPPNGWTKTGMLVVALEGGRPTKLEARDVGGSVVDSTAAPKQRKDARHWIEAATCRLGGLLAVAGASWPDDGTASFTVMKPVAPDEKSDLSIMCERPAAGDPRAAPGLDLGQQLRLAVQIFEGRLTTGKWRAWLRDLVDDLADKRPEARAPVRRTKADELRDEASRAGIAHCWFEGGLRE